ncbi:hypothetical protein [Methanoregula sp.]
MAQERLFPVCRIIRGPGDYGLYPAGGAIRDYFRLSAIVRERDVRVSVI